MMTYYNITFGPYNHYSIQETRTKARKRHNAIDTLEKIEKALKENLKYSSTFPAGHPLQKMRKAEAFQHLQAKASEIHQSYVTKQSKLCWLWRKIFSKKKKADAIFNRIDKLTLPTKHAKALFGLALNDVSKLGYKGKKVGKARRYLEHLSHNLHTLSQQDWKYGINNNNSFKDLVIHKKGQIAIEESLNRLKQLSISDLAKLFMQNVPLQHLKRAILTPPISTRQTFFNLKAANEALHIAVRNREVEVVKFLLSHGADANFSYQKGNTVLGLSIKQKTPRITQVLLQAKATIDPDLLHQAARKPHNHKNIELLLKYGANVNHLDSDRNSAIFIAIKNKNFTNMIALIRGKIDLNHINDSDKSPLHFAVDYGTPKMIGLLVQHGADPYKQHLLGDTPFITTIKKKDVAKVEAFIKQGIDLNYTKDEYSEAALSVAVDDGNIEIIQLLLKHGANPYGPLTRKIPFLLAIKNHDLAKVRAFIEGKTDLNYQTPFYGSPLHVALNYGTPEIIKLLIQHGAKPHQCDRGGRSPFFLAVKTNKLKAVHTFIAGGVDPNYTNKEGETALHVAARDGTPETIKLLLQYGANPHACDQWGFSPLETAISHKDVAKVQAFIEGGVDPTRANKDNETALHVAARDGTPEIIKLLLQQGLDPYQGNKSNKIPLIIAIEQESFENVKTFIQAKIGLTYVDKKGRTALHIAAKHGNAEIIELLMNEANLGLAVGRKQRTALHFAALSGTPQTIKLLLQHGADPHVYDQMESSPLDIAIRHQDLAKVQAFIEGGVNLANTNSDEETALHIAARHGTPEIIELLIKHGADPDLKDSNGQRPLDLLFSSDSDEALAVVKALIQNKDQHNPV
ncbi:MAG: ankyrin repeat domain-containing protein [Parachlamydiaceae bacterium]